MNDLQPIQFHTDTIYLVEHNGQPYTPVRPLVENIGLDWASQYVKLTSKKERWGVVMIPTPSAGGNQETICIPIRKTAAFLYSIDADRVRHDLKEKVEMYQEECDEVLWNYWTKGIAINGQVVPEDSMVISKDEYIELLKSKVAMLEAGRRKRPNRPLTDEDKKEIISMYSSGMSQADIVRATGRSKATVCYLVKFRSDGQEV